MASATGSTAILTVEIEGLLAPVLAALSGTRTQRYMAMEAQGLKGRSENPSSRTPPAT